MAGKVDIHDTPNAPVTITIDGDSASIVAGANEQAGDLTLRTGVGDPTIVLSGGNANLLLGGANQAGHIVLRNGTGTDTIRLHGGLVHHIPVTRIELHGDSGDIVAGGDGQDGDIVLRSGEAAHRIRLDAGGANIWLGGNGKSGDLVLFHADGDNISDQATISLKGRTADIVLGGAANQAGTVLLQDGAGNATIRLRGHNAQLIVGGGHPGQVHVRGEAGERRIFLDAGAGNILVGGNGRDGDIVLFPSTSDNAYGSQATIHLDGNAGDIILQNADCAEEFDVSESRAIEPGTVMVLDDGGNLQQSTSAYDRRVVGVVAGAGEYKPGLLLDRRQSSNTRLPISLVGKTCCRVDAQYAAIEAGDLLTTSPTPGHAMKATDRARAFGAVIGKALRPLNEGKGLIPILIALQ